MGYEAYGMGLWWIFSVLKKTVGLVVWLHYSNNSSKKKKKEKFIR